jgi:hypothetical protein
MRILSDHYLFVVLQICLGAGFIFLLLWDGWAAWIRRKSGVTFELRRSHASISKLAVSYSVAFSVIIQVINANAFRGPHWLLSDYSIVINLLDLIVIIYVCYFSGTGQDKILRLHNRLLPPQATSSPSTTPPDNVAAGN